MDRDGRDDEDEEKGSDGGVLEPEVEVEVDVEVQDRGVGDGEGSVGGGGGENGEEAEAEEVGMNLIKSMTQKLATEPIKVRVHDIEIKGNTKTKDSVIEAQLKELREVTSMQDLLQESVKANSRLRALGIFDKCVITLDAGPEELPGTANVIVEVEEVKRPFSGDLGVFSKPETKAWTLEGTVKYRNLVGYAETLDATGCYGLDTTSELSAGVTYPRFKGLPASLATRITLLTQDWQRYSSYRERLAGFSVGLVGDKQHDVSYNLTWRDLKDPSRCASKSVRRQLGHSLLSAVKYTYKIDERDSAFRPRRGIAFISTTQIAGLGLDSRLLRFARQEVELRLAIPLGFANAAVNLGIAGGVIVPWGAGFRTKPTPISDRFYMGGHSSLLGELRGPSALLGFRTRGVGPSELRRPTTPKVEISDGEVNEVPKKDTLGGDFAVSGFADFSFDLPTRFLKEYGIHAHTFTCAGNLIPLTGESIKYCSLRNFLSRFRVSSGAGIVIPTKLFRLEVKRFRYRLNEEALLNVEIILELVLGSIKSLTVNYCYVLRYQDCDRIKRGVQISLNSPN